MLRSAKVHGSVEEWGGRSVRLDFDKGIIETPSRIVNKTELNSRNNLLVLDGFEVPVVEYTARLDDTFPTRFARKNGTYASTKVKLRKFARTHRDKDVIFRPQLPSGIFFDNRGVKMLVDLQIEAGLSLIAVPELPTDVSKTSYLDCLSKAIRYAEKTAQRPIQVMPYIDASTQEHDRFQERLDAVLELVDKAAIMTMGVNIGSIDQYRPNLESIADIKVRSRDLWVHGSRLMDYSSQGAKTARHHVPQRFGVDTVALMVRQAPRGDDVRGTRALSGLALSEARKYVRFFNRPTVEILKDEELPVGSLDTNPCDCHVCEGRTTQDALEAVVLDPEGGVDEKNLRDFTRLHNMFLSNSEFEQSRAMSCRNELQAYFQQKRGLVQYSR